MAPSKVVDAKSALSQIKDGSIVAVSGFNMITTPEHLLLELYDIHREKGHPANLFIMSDCIPSTPGRALDQIAEKLFHDPEQKFLKGVLMPFLGFSPWLQKMVMDDRIECYSWPIGITSYWFREVASGRPGLLTKIGIGTFLDPRQDGAALNEKARKNALCKVSVINIEGEEHLLYQAPKPDFALVRATIADDNGNLSMEDEGTRGSVLSIAQAAKARPRQGVVISQVRWVAKSGTLNPRNVDVPGPLVDLITIAPKQHHWQSGNIEYDPRISYKVLPASQDASVDDVVRMPPKDTEKVIVRRVLLELAKLLEEKQAPVMVNLGIGIPAFVSSVVSEEDMADFIVTVLESGIWGGVALSGADFGLAINPFAISSIPDMFSNFEGGIIDAASLGFLQIDREGNVNPSMLPDKIVGPGGFPVIAGGAPRIYFAGSFSAGHSDICIQNNKLQIVRDGAIPKFIDKVFKVVFSGSQATKYGHDILYITERAVFKLTQQGITLQEIAPGIDLDKDILSKMSFSPEMKSVKEMDERIFRREKMGVKDEIQAKLRR